MTSPDAAVRLRHLYDQALGHLIDQAPVLARYHKALLDEGMDERAAIALTMLAHITFTGGLEDTWRVAVTDRPAPGPGYTQTEG